MHYGDFGAYSGAYDSQIVKTRQKIAYYRKRKNKRLVSLWTKRLNLLLRQKAALEKAKGVRPYIFKKKKYSSATVIEGGTKKAVKSVLSPLHRARIRQMAGQRLPGGAAPASVLAESDGAFQFFPAADTSASDAAIADTQVEAMSTIDSAASPTWPWLLGGVAVLGAGAVYFSKRGRRRKKKK